MRGGESELRCRIISSVGRWESSSSTESLQHDRTCRGELVLRMGIVPAVFTGIAGRFVSPRVGSTQNAGEGVLVRFYVVTPSTVVEALSAIRPKGDR